MVLFKKRKIVPEKDEDAPEFLDIPEIQKPKEEEEIIPEFVPEERKFSREISPSSRIEQWESAEEKQITKLPPRTKMISTSDSSQKSKPLFIKLEKFKEIITSIQAISRKVAYLEEIAQKIKEVKAREDAEIAQWQEQLNAIRAKLESIEENLSSKI